MTDKVIPPAGKLDVTSPFDGRLLSTVDTGGSRHVEAALSTAYALFRDRSSWLSVPERVAILQRTAALMEAQKSDLAQLAASEGGKPLQDSLVEVTRAIDGLHLCIETLRGHPWRGCSGCNDAGNDGTHRLYTKGTRSALSSRSAPSITR